VFFVVIKQRLDSRIVINYCLEVLFIMTDLLDFRLRENAMKEIQDTIESAGMAGQVKIF
jgi:hypothetical protein